MSIYAYLRVSTRHQAESGIGLNVQHAQLKKDGDKRTDSWASTWHGPAQFPGFYVDDGESAYSIDLFDRPAGKALRAVLKRGDTILFKDYSRGWRSARDFACFVELAEEEGWIIVVLGPSRVDLGTPMGRVIARFWVSMAEWESDIKSRRIKDALAVKRANGGDTRRRGPLPKTTKSGYKPSGPEQEPEPKVEIITGTMWPYVRCSSASSVESGLGLQHQWESCCDYYNDFSEENPCVQFGDIMVDAAVSALKIALRNRPQGKLLDAKLKSGDHVVFLRPDRAFGTMLDAIQTCEDWSARGIRIHFSELQLDLGTPEGKMILAVMAAFSEMERQIAKARNTEAYYENKRQGKWLGRQYNPFWRMYHYTCPSGGKQNQYVLDPFQIASFRLLLKMTQVYGWTKRRACERVEEMMAKREDRPPINQTGVMPRSKAAGRLKGKVVPHMSGKIFPLWTVRRFDFASEFYDATIALWRSLSSFERRRSWKLAGKYAVYRRQRTRPYGSKGPRKKTEKEIRDMAERKSKQMRDKSANIS